MVSREHRLTASAWHDGYWSPLYVYASSGAVLPGLDDEIGQCLDYIESSGPGTDFDPVNEHRRLTELLHHVQPQLAADKARRIGRGEGYAAADAWQHDTLNGPWSDHAKATAQRVHQALKDNNPEVVRTLPAPTGSDHDIRRILIMSGWLQPDTNDQAAHARWVAARGSIWTAYQTSFHEAVRETVNAACERILSHAFMLPPGLHTRDLASARFLGADTALTRAASLTMSSLAAQAILQGTDIPNPPTPTDHWTGNTPYALTSRIIDRDVTNVARTVTLGAMEQLLTLAWEDGRNAVWHPALQATALRTLDRPLEAQIIESTTNAHWQELHDAAGPFPPARSEPYIRPATPTTDRRAAPQGWIVEPVGNWNGTPHEVVYDPRCFDITIGTADRPPLPATSWDLKGSNGPRRFWIQDRAAATRTALDRLDHRLQQPRQQPPAPEPPRGLDP